MTHTQPNNYSIYLIVATLLAAICNSFQAYSLPVQHYANESVLSSGKWVKISTSHKGVHCIDAATLQAWGFTDATSVSLYGKDGYMLPETFDNNDNDDLCPLPVYVENGNLYFYASGSTQWQQNGNANSWTHTNNYYSDITFYFLTDSREQVAMQQADTQWSDGIAMTTFDEYAVYENDLICLGQTGRLYLGEDLLYNNTIRLNAPGIAGDKITIQIAAGANATTTCTLTTRRGNTTLTPNMTVKASDSYTYIKEATQTYTIPAGEQIELSFTAKSSGTIKNFYLDYVRMFYTRHLAMDNSPLHFRNVQPNGNYYAINTKQSVSNNIRVWDITDVNAPLIHSTQEVNGKVVFTPLSQGDVCNEYVAFDISKDLSTPQFVCNVEHQNLHGIDYIPDMVILTSQAFINEAEKIAQIHRQNDHMKVLVCDQLSVFNEFSGGTPDATAIRRMMKMFYDRAQALYVNAPQYLLLYGRSSYNNRAISAKLHNDDNKLLITYQSESSTDQRYSYMTDDYYGLLGDNTGKDITSEEINLSIGRIPVKNIDESQKVYNKLITYINQKPTRNLWKNKACFIGLNGDNNLHIHQMNNVSLETVEKEQQHIVVDKIYMSAYNSRPNAPYEGARDQIYRNLEEGAFIYSYMGHAGHTSIGTNVINITHAKEMTNNLWPVFITATCDVCPFDKDENSVGEELFRNEKGGFIALYTTTRTVYTTGNEKMNQALLHEFYIPGADGKIRLGDVMRRAKKKMLHDNKGNRISDANKLKYCLIGDPALAIPLPTHDIVIESINGKSVTDNSIINIPANGEVILTGSIYNKTNNIATDYNGVLCYEMYDAEEKKTAQEKVGTTGTVLTEEFGIRQYKLVTAADTIVNGRFTTTFRIPTQTLQSDTTTLISLYAFDTNSGIEAAGYCKNIVIDGVNETAQDVTAPIFSQIWIGNNRFSEGGTVESNTLFHCDISDIESGIACNEIAIGKHMTLRIDGQIECNDLAGYYSPHNEYGKGNIDYPLTNLSVGTHQITVKAFDNAGNASEITVSCTVEAELSTQYELQVAENPAIAQATISLSGAIEPGMTIRYVITDSHTGKEVWTTETQATEVIWNIPDSNKATPGQYNTYALIDTGTKKIVTKEKKIIVLAQ